MYIEQTFTLSPLIKRRLKGLTPKFGYGLLGAATYYRTYSRLKADGSQENWADTVIRVVEGVMSIRKDWYVKENIKWDEVEWQNIAAEMADAIFHFRFLPAGRMLWSLGSDVIPVKGGLAAFNCSYFHVTHLSKHASELMDALMLGVGTGWGATDWNAKLWRPQPDSYIYTIPDTREGWTESVQRLIESYEDGSFTVEFDYSEVRPYGTPIKTFGGVASGPEPLKRLHDAIRDYLDDHVSGKTSKLRCATDVINAIGCCVVAGNVRRSAQLSLGNINDSEFLNFKNYDLNPDRAAIGWMSNNSVRINSAEDFASIGDIADMIRDNGEPGVVNFMNIQKYARMGEESPDTAIGTNPCSEATLEHAELCCLVEVFPTKCVTEADFYKACELATLFASTVSLLLTNQADINAVITRNHRIGVSISGVADWFDNTAASDIIRIMRKGYRVVERTNQWYNYKANVDESIRKTVIKPSGSVSLLAGVSPGMHWPIYNRYIRRIRVGEYTPIVDILTKAGIPYEADVASSNTLIFEFPVQTGANRGQRDITMWQKGAMVQMLQRHWADQMVSNTITFDPKTEAAQIEDFLSLTLPNVKSYSLLPETEEGAYAQMPYEQITKVEYDKRAKAITDIDWSTFGGSDGQDSKFCSNEECEI